MRWAPVLAFVLLASCAKPTWEQPAVVVENGQQWTRSASVELAPDALPTALKGLQPKRCLQATYAGAGGIDVVQCDMGSSASAFDALQKTMATTGVYPVAENRFFLLVSGSQEQTVISAFVAALRRQVTI